ncbi:MAG: hypothetical protein LUG51_03815 [Tannerellaceae bacterium]|nr:hypothetical protein [Tannerellaceae bacterium]
MDEVLNLIKEDIGKKKTVVKIVNFLSKIDIFSVSSSINPLFLGNHYPALLFLSGENVINVRNIKRLNEK